VPLLVNCKRKEKYVFARRGGKKSSGFRANKEKDLVKTKKPLVWKKKKRARTWKNRKGQEKDLPLKGNRSEEKRTSRFTAWGEKRGGRV